MDFRQPVSDRLDLSLAHAAAQDNQVTDCWCYGASKTFQVLVAFGQHNGGPTLADNLNDVITK
jgi:hypothetical protein